MNFFVIGRSLWGAQKFFLPQILSDIPKGLIKFQRILKLKQQLNMMILLVTLNFGRGSHAHGVDPRPKLFWLVNPGQTSQVSSKSVILAFRLTFVSCVEALLNQAGI